MELGKTLLARQSLLLAGQVELPPAAAWGYNHGVAGVV
jgi:hypothetical protein